MEWPQSIECGQTHQGNIIRYSPNAFLDNDYDVLETKIRYLLARAGADYKIIAESGLLELDVIETAAKYEFLYRRKCRYSSIGLSLSVYELMLFRQSLRIERTIATWYAEKQAK